jgi:acetyl/propionyl-CoA carboxylase alpha subunit
MKMENILRAEKVLAGTVKKVNAKAGSKAWRWIAIIL